MKIIRGEAWVLRMRMAEPYAIAYASSDTAVNVFLRLETENGLLGYGCGAPDVNVTGETPEAVLGMLLQHVLPALTGVDPLRPVFAQKLLDPFLSSFPSAKHAVDMALFDILGKVAGVPAWKLLGGFRDKILTSVTVGILPEKETVERAREWVSQGFSCLKIKGGKDWEEDASRILKVREAVGEGVRLRFDANQGFSTSQAISFANKTKRVQLECLEQPTSAEDWKELRKVNEISEAKVMADEGLLTIKGAALLAEMRACSLFNVKLTKVGGTREAKDILSIARAAGIGVMIGCMDESALGISAGLALALGSEAVELADLDGHIGLIGDPFANAVHLKEGMLIPSEKPGWGYSSV